ncbi:MAG: magnesium/cobalt transporter CorA [Firmicutes bacterium]|nr:magnesium/cobalt transporter CorA [Bacillota bacterium]
MAITFWQLEDHGHQATQHELTREALCSGQHYWLDLEIDDLPHLEPLRDQLPGHALSWEDASKPGQRPKYEDNGAYLFIVMRGLDTTRSRLTDQLNTVQLACFLTAQGLITVRSGPMASATGVHERLTKGATLLASGPDALLHALLDDLVDSYGPHVEAWETEMDHLLREALDRPRQRVMAHILSVRKHLLLLRRLAFGQREILAQLAKERDGLVQEAWRPYFQDVYDHLSGLVEVSETLRDSVTIAVDVYMNSVNNRLNEVMKVLTVISSIMLPLTLVTGIYGMNFQWMPGLQHPHGFFWMLGVMGLIAGGMILYFKRAHWL